MKEKQVVIKTGLTKLDAMIGGFRGGELTIIAGGPLMGKTAFLHTIINNRPAKTKQSHVIYFPLNLPMLEARLRLDCLNARVDYLKTTYWNITQDELNRLKKARKFNFDDSGILIFPGTSIELSELVEAVSERVKKCGIKVVVIDSLNLGMNRKHREITIIGDSLKTLAKRLNVAIIVSYSTVRKNIKELKKIADKILFIHRESCYSQMNIDSTPKPAQIIVAKNQNGLVGVVDVQFTPSYMRFDNIYSPFKIEKILVTQ